MKDQINNFFLFFSGSLGYDIYSSYSNEKKKTTQEMSKTCALPNFLNEILYILNYLVQYIFSIYERILFIYLIIRCLPSLFYLCLLLYWWPERERERGKARERALNLSCWKLNFWLSFHSHHSPFSPWFQLSATQEE